MNYHILAVLLLSLSQLFFKVAPLYAQTAYQLEPEYTVGKPSMNCNESVIIIDPAYTDRQIVATNTNHMFVSRNKGRSYKHQTMKSPLGVYGDPVLIHLPSGIIAYAHLAKAKNKLWPDTFDQIVVQYSANKGRSWSKGVGTGKNGKMHDKPWLCVDDNPRSPFYNRVYLTWTQFDKYESRDPKDSTQILFAYSTNQTKSFTSPIRISERGGDCLDGDSTVEGATACIGPNGEVYVAWAGHEALYLTQSKDGGENWYKNRIIYHIPKGWDLDIPNYNRTNGLPFIVSDSAGVLYIVTVLEENGYNKAILLQSRNQGLQWERIDLNTTAQSHAMMPHLSLDKKSGTLAILFYEVVNAKTYVRLLFKKAVQNSFETLTLNPKPFSPPSQNVFFGDYIQVNTIQGIIAATWTEIIGDQTIVKTRRLKIIP